ncbi:Protein DETOXIFICATION 16 [Linum perenne]
MKNNDEQEEWKMRMTQMETPLLNAADDEQDHEAAINRSIMITVDDGSSFWKYGGEEEEEEEAEEGDGGWVRELKKQIWVAGPMVVVSLFQYSLQLISVMYVGRLGQLPLASASLATSFAGVTGFSFMMGMGGAVETFCGQAYGAGKHKLLGIHLQRSMVVISLLTIPISILWAFTNQIFILLRQDENISSGAGTYAIFLIPSILPYGLLQCQLRFLQTQNLVSPLVVATALTTILHFLLCWAFIFRFGFGSQGAALSVAVSYWFNVVVLDIYIRFSSACRNTWTGFSKEGLKDLSGFLKLGIPSALMVCLEFWSYEFLVFMSGLLPNPQLETSMMSLSTRVANELGAGRPKAAILAVRVGTCMSIVQGLSLSLILVWIRHVWGYVYTNDEELAAYIAAVIPILAVSNFMDALQAVFSGVARGCGWQLMGTFVNLGAYYLAGLPAAMLLTFVFNFGGMGLWMGIICGSTIQAFVLFGITQSTNWELEVRKAKARLYASYMSSTDGSSIVG